MHNIIIQHQSPQDVEAVNNVYYKTWLSVYPNKDAGISIEDIEHAFIDDFSEAFVTKEKERIAKLPEQERPLIAKDGERVVGICVVKNTVDCHSLETIYILPEYQGRGIGKTLWDEAQKQLDTTRDITLRVTAYNKNAIQFYEKLGFVTLGDVYQDDRLIFKSGAMFPTIKMIRKAEK